MTKVLAVMCIVMVGAGCGPVTVPMVQRLPEDGQRQVDEIWQNMLTPPDRLDHPVHEGGTEDRQPRKQHGLHHPVGHR